jgi:hypothetical protein
MFEKKPKPFKQELDPFSTDFWEKDAKQPQLLTRLGLQISKEDATTIEFLRGEKEYDCMAVEVDWKGIARLLIASSHRYNPEFFSAGQAPENWNNYLEALRSWQSSQYPSEKIQDGAVIISDRQMKHSIFQGSRVTRESGGWSFPGPIPYGVQRLLPTLEADAFTQRAFNHVSLFLSIASARMSNAINGGKRRV